MGPVAAGAARAVREARGGAGRDRQRHRQPRDRQARRRAAEGAAVAADAEGRRQRGRRVGVFGVGVRGRADQRGAHRPHRPRALAGAVLHNRWRGVDRNGAEDLACAGAVLLNCRPHGHHVWHGMSISSKLKLASFNLT